VIRKVLTFILLFSLRGFAQTDALKPIDCSQLLTWMTAGIPSQRLLRLARERGVGFGLDEDTKNVLLSAGVDQGFIRALQSARSAKTDSGCPADLVQAAALVHRQKYEEAEPIVRKLLLITPENADLHLALGHLRQQRGDMDEAFDAYADAKDLNPFLPEVHNGLSYVFSQSNDPENAIAEARTALSLDPKNAEGYRYLGLALYVNDNYPAALYALRESLAQDPKRGESYYAIGMVRTTQKDFAGAADAYREAIRLNPGLEKAQLNLGMVLRELAQQRRSVAVGRKSQKANSSN